MLYKITYDLTITVEPIVEDVLYLEYKIDRKKREEKKLKTKKKTNRPYYLCFEVV